MPRTQRIQVSLETETVTHIDRIARELGMSLSAVSRVLIRVGLSVYQSEKQSLERGGSPDGP